MIIRWYGDKRLPSCGALRGEEKFQEEGSLGTGSADVMWYMLTAFSMILPLTLDVKVNRAVFQKLGYFHFPY